jgi:hypothetical protein
LARLHIFLEPLSICAIKLPNKINESSQVAAAPIEASAGANKIQETTKAKKPNNALSLVS